MSKIYLFLFREKNSLIVLSFHALFKNEEDSKKNIINPYLGITLSKFKRVITYFIKSDYQIISLSDLGGGLNPNKKYLLLTFDDGYYNNNLLLNTLEKNKIPGLFFITTNPIKNQTSFWTDGFYREVIKRNTKNLEIFNQKKELKGKRSEEIKSILIQKYGKGCLNYVGDIDRPFKEKELINFSKNKSVNIGNHTADHAILTNYDYKNIEFQITSAQKYLTKLLGAEIPSFAYPNGNYSDNITELLGKLNFKFAFTMLPKKNNIKDIKKNRFIIGRFCINGIDDIKSQCDLIRSDFTLNKLFIYLFKRNLY